MKTQTAALDTFKLSPEQINHSPLPLQTCADCGADCGRHLTRCSECGNATMIIGRQPFHHGMRDPRALKN